MQELFTVVLSGRDLSRAGDLFSVADSSIVDDLSEVLARIAEIASQPDYCRNDNDQSVVEICVTRALSCVRETGSVEKHCAALVALLETCLHHDLRPKQKDEDPPHAKIAADVISCIFLASDAHQTYGKRAVMEAALPVAVEFLHKGNAELSRNMARYLSLAAIHHAALLRPHVRQIVDSVVAGNYPLCRALARLYEVSPKPLDGHATALVALLPRADRQDKLALLSLFELMAESDPAVLEASAPRLLAHLCRPPYDPADCVCVGVLKVLHKIARRRPAPLVEHAAAIKRAAAPPHATAAHVALAAQILAEIGKLNEERAQEALDFALEQLAGADRSCHAALIKETTALCRAYPALFNDKVLHGVRHRNNNNVQHPPSNNNNNTNSVQQQNQVNQTTGGVTIVKLGGGNSATVTNSSAPPTYASIAAQQSSPPTTTATNSHVGYTRRAKLGDSRSTGRLHTPSNTHRSMTRLNVAGGSVGGLHKSLTRLSSSQQINNQSAAAAAPTNPSRYSTAVSNTNGSKWANVYTNSASNKGGGISSGGVTVTTVAQPSRSRHGNSRSQGNSRNHVSSPGQIVISPGTSVSTGSAISSGPMLLPANLGASSQIQSISINPLTLGKSSDSIVSPVSSVAPSVSVQHSNMALGPISVINSSGIPSSSSQNGTSSSLGSGPIGTSMNNNSVSVSGPVTVTSRRNNNTSVTMINSNPSQRISVFEPYPMRDTVQHFCEKHLDKIKSYMDKASLKIPPPVKCIIEERRAKKLAKLLFACQARGQHCLYSRTFFTMRTRNPRIWIHLMFLALQSRSSSALSSRDSSVSSLKHCWDILKCENKTFLTLVTSAFPGTKDQEMVLNELRQAGFFDVFELTPTREGEFPQWGCFLCNHPERAVGFLNGNTQPVIEGQLKEKKGRWRLFRRWRTRYFTLSGAHLSCKGSSGGESIDINQIRSVKVSRGARNIPKAFEIFTGDQTLILKPKDGKNAEEWVQCLSIVVAHSQARDAPAKSNSLPARGITLRNI